MNIIKLGDGAIESTIVDFENRHGIKIPDSFRRSLIENNVFFPEPENFNIKHVSEIDADEETTDTIGVFLGFMDEDEEKTLEWALSIYKNRIDSSYLPIAFDLAGNVICLGLNEDVYGKVFFWDHEEENANRYICLADDFDSFLNSFRD